ncbi:MAG: HAMP domain-containing protein [Magnetococcales bacterium]|nr:HAMP domain-containing protein [Magnetococcales bacterium]
MQLSDIPIRLKLPLTIGAGLTLFAGVVLLYTLTFHQTITRYEHLMTHEVQIQHSAQKITRQMFQARRAEKDFLMRKDTALLATLNQHVDLAIQEARTIEQLTQNDGQQKEIIQRLVLIEHLTRYRAVFTEMVALWQTKGLDHQDGEQGKFRQAARTLEETMQPMGHQEAMIDYLNMRRMEKDYLLRQEEEYLQGVEKLAADLEKRLHKSSLNSKEKEQVQKNLTDYLTAFRKVAALDRQLEANRLLLRENVRKVEPLADEIEAIADRLADETTAQTRQFAEKAALWIFLISIITILVCGFLSIFMVRGIVRSIGALWRFAHDVAGGNLEAKTDLSGADEIGQLAQVLRDMVNRMRAIRLIADRMVMIMALIGRGAVPEEITVDFHGDFQKISNSLNDMIRRLRELRNIAGQVDRVAKGEIPEKLTGEFQGDFKRINDAMNTIIDKIQEIGGFPASEV